jgi:hypothetical protein
MGNDSGEQVVMRSVLFWIVLIVVGALIWWATAP